MISRLPHWVETAAFVLALVAGYVNAVGLVGFDLQAVSHLSGSTNLLGVNVAQGSHETALYLFGVLLAFLVGAAWAGWLLHGTTLKRGHYDIALICSAVLLFAAMALFWHFDYPGIFLASAACGLQNALATTYSGAIVRTTHVTGIFTDLGIMLGSLVRGEPLNRRKAKIFLIIITGLICGGYAGTLLFGQLRFDALAVPAIACLLMAAAYRFYRRYHNELLEAAET
ncbi:YoaK family protein [Pokkaliibacter sp. CJK22405]|uniref:YoaK family protein n=1 Tax=Pokkaliibacter sp. CJK22405 TaxID=3384615 RepID=UPI003984DA84